VVFWLVGAAGPSSTSFFRSNPTKLEAQSTIVEFCNCWTT